MSTVDNNDELVIIRRRSAFVDSEYKSGVWKIAYADFMTAMMAFFLVMWLLHATNQETRESVASYFNPVKLTDSSPDRKGVNDPKKAQPNESESDGEVRAPAPIGPAASAPPPATSGPTPSAGIGAPGASDAARPPRYDEAALFRDPYAVLTDIAGGPASMANRERRIGIALGRPDRLGTKGGEAYRDPFDPIYWQIAPPASIERRAVAAKERGSLPIDDDLAELIEGEAKKPSEGRLDATISSAGHDPQAAGQQASKAAEAPPSSPPGSPPRAAPPAGTPASAPAESAGTPREPNRPSEAADAAAAPLREPSRPSETADAATAPPNGAAAASLQAALRSLLETGAKPGPSVEVAHVSEGLLISLTDATDFSMFAIGSAEPQPELVRTIDKITPLLAGYAGGIVIGGHTDGRPFRTPSYDNWRLSTARAQMAYYMLVRGGIDPKRIERIEGHADRRLKRPNDPFAAPNRRIEILVQERRQ